MEFNDNYNGLRENVDYFQWTLFPVKKKKTILIFY